MILEHRPIEEQKTLSLLGYVVVCFNDIETLMDILIGRLSGIVNCQDSEYSGNKKNVEVMLCGLSFSKKVDCVIGLFKESNFSCPKSIDQLKQVQKNLKKAEDKRNRLIHSKIFICGNQFHSSKTKVKRKNITGLQVSILEGKKDLEEAIEEIIAGYSSLEEWGNLIYEDGWWA
jgi:hypothetical protein